MLFKTMLFKYELLQRNKPQDALWTCANLLCRLGTVTNVSKTCQQNWGFARPEQGLAQAPEVTTGFSSAAAGKSVPAESGWHAGIRGRGQKWNVSGWMKGRTRGVRGGGTNRRLLGQILNPLPSSLALYQAT